MARSSGKRRPVDSAPPATNTSAPPATWSAIPGIAILPLRLFLGITFVYAGIQKIGDPNFLRPGTPTYIGTQLLGFSRGSPIRTVLLHMMEHAQVIGMLTIATELTIGTLVLTGIFTRPAAFVGFILSFTFFLSASWHTYPYFFGSDIVFVMCWLTIMLTGPGPYSLDAQLQPRLHGLLARWVGEGLRPAVPVVLGVHGLRGTEERSWGDRSLTRAEVVTGGLVALGLIALGLVPRGGSSSGPSKLAGSSTGPQPTTAPGSGPSPTAAPTSGSAQPPAGVPAGARKIGNISQLPANTAGTVQDPKTGDPVIVIHTGGSHYYAYDAVCTHAGCTVQYDPQSKLIVCPCHGGTFDPAHGAQVVAGPPPSPLAPVEMKITKDGSIYIV
jgi:thiosulfate dehydrogenase [quinone] large subunit